MTKPPDAIARLQQLRASQGEIPNFDANQPESATVAMASAAANCATRESLHDSQTSADNSNSGRLKFRSALTAII
jgi:hypothetical protein